MTIASENTQASHFVQCMLIFILCMSLLCCIFIPKINVRYSSKATNGIRRSMENLMEGSSSFTLALSSSTIPSSTSDRPQFSEENEGMKVLEHPKLQQQTKQELRKLKVAYANLKRQYEELASTLDTNELITNASRQREVNQDASKSPPEADIRDQSNST